MSLQIPFPSYICSFVIFFFLERLCDTEKEVDQEALINNPSKLFIKQEAWQTNGKILLTTQYFENKQSLVIYIQKAYDFLPRKDRSSTWRTFLRLCIEPGKRQKADTKHVKGQEPIFNEKILFRLSPACMNEFSVKIKLYCCFKSALTSKELIGSTIMMLRYIERDGKKRTQVGEFIMPKKRK